MKPTKKTKYWEPIYEYEWIEKKSNNLISDSENLEEIIGHIEKYIWNIELIFHENIVWFSTYRSTLG